MLNFFCSCIKFYILLSPYLCFISFLYLDSYVLGEDSWTSKGTFMQTKHLCVLIDIRIKGEVGIVEHVYKPSGNFLTDCSKAALLLWILFVICVCHTVLSVSCSLVVTSWEKADHLALIVCDVFLCFCHFHIILWCPGSGLVLDCIDS